MVAVTVTEVYDNTLTNEGYLRIAHLKGGRGFTYTPGNSSGKTIKILSVFNNTSGTANIPTTISTGVITFDPTSSGAIAANNEEITLLYTLV